MPGLPTSCACSAVTRPSQARRAVQHAPGLRCVLHVSALGSDPLVAAHARSPSCVVKIDGCGEVVAQTHLLPHMAASLRTLPLAVWSRGLLTSVLDLLSHWLSGREAVIVR